MTDAVTVVSGAPSREAADAFRSAVESGADWIWLCDDEDVPAPECLERLLEVGHSGDAVGIVGPRLLLAEPDPHGPPQLVSAGVTTTPAGHRFNPVHPGEVDQGQHGRTEDVYGLDTPGMLISAAAARSAGPPPAVLPTSYRGIEYSRRVRAAGFRVVLAPAAGLHLPAGSARAFATSPRPLRAAADARAEHRYRLSRVRPRDAFPAALWLLLCALGAVLGSLAANDPRGALRWLGACAHLRRDARAVSRLRRTAPRTEPAAALLAAPADLAAARREQREVGVDGTAAWWQPGETSPAFQRGSAGEQGAAEEATGTAAAANTTDELQSYSGIGGAQPRSVLSHPLTWVLLGTLIAGILMGLRLLGPGVLTGGALPRLDVDLQQILIRLFSLRHEAGLGSQSPADPLLAVLAVVSLPVLGDLDLAVRLILILAPAAAAALMYGAAGCLVRARSVRALLALVWGCSPVLLFAVADGRVGAVLALLLIPVAVRAVHTAVVRRSTEAAAAAGLVMAAACAGMPILLPPVLILGVVLTLRMRRVRLLWTAVPVLALHGPWLAGALREPGAFLADPGRTLAHPVARSWNLLLGWPEVPVSEALAGSAAATWMWLLPLVSVPLVLAAITAYLRPSAPDGLVIASTVLTVGGLSLAIAQTMTAAGITAVRMVSAWPGAGMALLTLGLCGLLAAAQLRGGGRRGAELRPRSRITRFAAVGAAASALLALSAMSAEGAVSGTQVSRTQDARLPVFAQERADGALAQRTLLLEVSEDGDAAGEVLGTLARSGTHSVLDMSTVASAAHVEGLPPERRPVPLDPADTALAEAVAGLTTGSGSAQLLAELGVGFVVLTGPEGPALEQASRAVSAAAGLDRLGDADQGRLWQVDAGGAEVSWAGVADADGNVAPVPTVDGSVQVPDGPDGRVLVLAERSGFLTATGTEGVLEEGEPAYGWSQTYLLPAGAQEVELSASPVWFRVLGGAAGALLVLSVVVALPLGRRVRA